MNRTTRFTTIGAILFAVLGTALSAGPLRAEDLTGKFTLPIEVRWGGATLPAGDYTFRINPQITPFMATVSGPNGTFFINAAASSDHKFSGHSALVLARRGRTGVVREMHLTIPGLKPTSSREDVRVYDRGTLVSNVETKSSNQGGIALIYSAPKGEPAVIAQTPELIQRIPILIAAR
jgi:hypothetical protein